MAWVRIHENAVSHPKIVGIFDPKNPFCLWIWGLSYCQAHLTNGVIPRDAITFRTGNAIAVLESRRLWERHPDGNYRVHDYLEWNDSRETITKKRSEAKERMQNARQSRSREHLQRTNTHVLRSVGSNTEDPEEERKIDDRAAALLDNYAAWYSAHRHGAKTLLIHNNLEFIKACELCRLWDDARLEKLATIVLTTDEPFISGTDRSFSIFAMKASWADDRLRQWERDHGAARA